MAPKKKKQNGFMGFVHEWKNKYGAPDRSFDSCVMEAGKIWKQMSLEEREPYNTKAKNQKGYTILRLPDDQLPTKEPVKTPLEIELEKANKELRIKKAIDKMLQDSASNANLEKEPFHFIMANYFVKILNSDNYLPAEVAVAEFSLIDGVSRIYHTFINPGNIIYGNQNDALQHSKSTHRLPLPPKALGEKNMGLIYQQIVQFLIDADESKTSLPLFTRDEDIESVKSCVEFLKLHCTDENACKIELDIYPIKYLFHTFKVTTCNISGLLPPQTMHLSTAIFERDIHENQSNIGCPFHEEKDISMYCAQSCVLRWGFMFAEYICPELAIEMRPNLHFPDNSDFKCTIIEPHEQSSNIKKKMEFAQKRMKQEWKSYRNIQNDDMSKDSFHYRQNYENISRSKYEKDVYVRPKSTNSEENNSSEIDLDIEVEASKNMQFKRFPLITSSTQKDEHQTDSFKELSRTPSPPPAPIGLNFGEITTYELSNQIQNNTAGMQYDNDYASNKKNLSFKKNPQASSTTNYKHDHNAAQYYPDHNSRNNRQQQRDPRHYAKHRSPVHNNRPSDQYKSSNALNETGRYASQRNQQISLSPKSLGDTSNMERLEDNINGLRSTKPLQLGRGRGIVFDYTK